MTSNPTNHDRARWAKDALAIFTARTFSGEHPDSMHQDDLECAITDLVADLLHYAYQQDFDTSFLLDRAIDHFITDTREEARS